MFDGINKATRVVTKRDGDRFIDGEVIESRFRRADPDTFTEPK